MTLALGHGDQIWPHRQMLIPYKGFMTPVGIADCQHCRRGISGWMRKHGYFVGLIPGSNGDLYEGRTVTERHWLIDRANPVQSVGLNLKCLYSVYMELLEQAWIMYDETGDPLDSQLANKGRVVLLSVQLRDILCVSQTLGESLRENDIFKHDRKEITIRAAKLKVNDLIDQITLVPSEQVLDAILHAPSQWHDRWHPLVDRIKPWSFSQFQNQLFRTLQLVE